MGCEYDRVKATELSDLIHWHQIPPNKIGGKDANYDKWQDICEVDPPAHLKWTDVNEYQLTEMKKREINI